jgi:hypothetical protein
MILSKSVDILINYKNYKHYTSKGYNCTYGIISNIKVYDLPKGSHIKINVKCDICGKEKEISYQKYNKNISKYNIYTCSEKCAQFKNVKTNNEKYGTDYPAQSEIVKNKTKNTNNIRYGVDNVFESNTIKNKIIETNNKNFGVNYPQQNIEILKKSNNTNIKKYGFNRPSKNLQIKNKIIETDKLNLKNKFHNIIDINYDNNNIVMLCEKGHQFNIHLKTLRTRNNNKHIICTICNPITKFVSTVENDLLNFIKENYKDEIIINNRKIIHPLEIDIYLPKLKLAFEFNGMYWHSELNKDKNYHKTKTDKCMEKGIELFHIYEDDWTFKQEIIKSMILNKLNIFENIDEVEIREVDDFKEFLFKNSLEDYNYKLNIGLFYDNNLVSLLSFENKILKFCNKLNTNVIDGELKLFNYLNEKYNPKEVIIYADKSNDNGNLYKKLGFKLDSIIEPSIINSKFKIYNSGYLKFIL